MTAPHHVEHQQDSSGGGAFVIETNGTRTAELTYAAGPGKGVITADHTWTDPSLRGQGVAGTLLAAFLEWVEAQGLLVVPACSYVAKAFTDRPELARFRAPG